MGSGILREGEANKVDYSRWLDGWLAGATSSAASLFLAAASTSDANLSSISLSLSFSFRVARSTSLRE